MVNILASSHFGRSEFGHRIKTNFIPAQIANLQIRLILIFYERVWN